MNRAMRAALGASVVILAAVAVACGSHAPTLDVVGTAGPQDEAGAEPGDGGESPSHDAGPTGVFTSGDASGLPSGVVFDCQPGTYSGTFTTMVTSDAGGLFSLFSYNWTGNLSITLQGSVTNTGAGEIPSPTLTIAPGAKLAGVDANGGHFNADLSGQLDCPSKTLTATVANGAYNYFGGDAGGIPMQGSMTASYDGTSSPPVLSMGGMDLSSSQLMGLSALGTWTAKLQ